MIQKNNTILDAFIKQRSKRQNHAIIEARKLVNLYRHLALFGADYLEKYNQMLLAASPEVQSALPDVMGGTIVRQYRDFLQSNSSSMTEDGLFNADTDDKYQYAQAESYLPSPDDVPPFQLSEYGQSDAGHMKKTVAELMELQKNQQEILVELLGQQNAQVTDQLSAVLHTTQDLSVRQLEALKQLTSWMKQNNRPDAYSMAADDVRTASQAGAGHTPVYTDADGHYSPEVKMEPIKEDGTTNTSRVSEQKAKG